MTNPAVFAFVAGLGLCAAVFAAPDAQAQRWHGPPGSSGPQGYFVVNAHACAPLHRYREDRRRLHAQWSRQPGYRLRCAPGAFAYVPTRAEQRWGVRTQDVRAREAVWNPRARAFVTTTRWGGPVPVRVAYGPEFVPSRQGVGRRP